jgi:hypothetical protein
VQNLEGDREIVVIRDRNELFRLKDVVASGRDWSYVGPVRLFPDGITQINIHSNERMFEGTTFKDIPKT